MKIRKATNTEIAAYHGVYPLHGFVALMAGNNEVNVPVEYLGEGPDEPNYEAILPEGFHLEGEQIHTVLGVTQSDLLTRLSYGLEPCFKSCQEGGAQQ